jgi:hypothetical protein
MKNQTFALVLAIAFGLLVFGIYFVCQNPQIGQ